MFDWLTIFVENRYSSEEIKECSISDITQLFQLRCSCLEEECKYMRSYIHQIICFEFLE